MVKKMHSSDSSADTGSSKNKGGTAGPGLLDSELANSVRDSAQQIWLAGMGAFAKAQAEGGKVFDKLVKEGSNLQKKTQGLAEDKFSEVSGRMSAMADSVSAKAGQNWDKLEAIFEQRTAKALAKLGVPTAKDVETLGQRVDALAAAVAKMGNKASTGAVKTVRAAAPAKTRSVAPKTAAKTSPRAPAKAPATTPAKAPAKAAAKRARKTAAA